MRSNEIEIAERQPKGVGTLKSKTEGSSTEVT
jgi:hypothetical protein